MWRSIADVLTELEEARGSGPFVCPWGSGCARELGSRSALERHLDQHRAGGIVPAPDLPDERREHVTTTESYPCPHACGRSFATAHGAEIHRRKAHKAAPAAAIPALEIELEPAPELGSSRVELVTVTMRPADLAAYIALLAGRAGVAEIEGLALELEAALS